jgi:hypothetical protein
MTNQQQPVYVIQPARSSGLGIASFILGILGTITFCLLPLSITLAVVGLVLGVVGLIVAASSGGQTKSTFAVVGILTCCLPFMIWALIAAGIVAAGAHGASLRNAFPSSQPASQPATDTSQQ